MRYAMAIDLRRCVGCDTCSIACKVSNNLPKDMLWLKVNTVGGAGKDTASGTYPNVAMSYLPVNCMHCTNAPCVPACPTKATTQREDGIVTVDSSLCIGCGACITACPYEGVRTLNEGEPEFYLDFELGHPTAPKHVANVVEKCNFCVGRLEQGEKPACMELCPGRARYFGDIDDPNSEISKLIASREVMRLQEDKGTEPNIYYLV